MREDVVDEHSRREASDWMIALQERPDDAALRRRFRTWRRDPTNDHAWRDLEKVGDVIRAAAAGSRPAIRRRPMDRRWHRVGRMAAAPAAIAACGAALIIGYGMLPPIGADATTGTGEVRRLLLADGSRVTLAPQSAIAVEDGTARHVRLLRGAAFFDIRHDGAHPFRVDAGDATATDLGTAFEVRHDAGTMRVAVREGLVRTSCREGWIDRDMLRPGETQEVDCAAGTHGRARVAPATVASWTDGQLVVVDRPLGEVVTSLRPWHHGLLVARGAGMARRVTGVYDLRDPERALAALRQAHGATTMRITPWITIVTID